MALPVLDTAVLFWPRGGSAQVVRYLLRELNTRGWTTRLHAGSLGRPGDPSHGPTFYAGLDLRPYDHNPAYAAFTRGENPQHGPLPFHPSYEDRGTCPDPLFSAVPRQEADGLSRAWTRHLTTHRSPEVGVLHLHHLSHLQTSALAAYPHIPRLTTLHGTELKLLAAMRARIRLARRVGASLPDLAHRLHSDNPHRTAEAAHLARSARLDEEATALLRDTAWHKWLHSPYWTTRLRRAATSAGQLVVVSAHDQDLATRLLTLRQAPPIVPNGVDTTAFRPLHLTDRQRLALLRRWLVTDPKGWDASGEPGSIRYTETDLRRLHDRHGRPRPLVMWVGRFLDFKRVPVLLNAFAQARARLSPAPALLMWGGYPGECEGTHPALIARTLDISDDVFFVGWRGHDELPAGLNCADLMAAPAVHEPFGMVYLEAMACGTPPIATATGGPSRTIIADGPNATGWLVRPDDPTDLAHTLHQALHDNHARALRATNGPIHIADTYSWTRTADRYLDLYRQAGWN